MSVDYGFLEEKASAATRAHQEIEARLATWVAAANATALLLCLNALLNHAVCNWTTLQPVTFIFVAGMALAFWNAVVARDAQVNFASTLSSAHIISIKQNTIQAGMSDASQRNATEEHEHWVTQAAANKAELDKLSASTVPTQKRLYSRARFTLLASASLFVFGLSWILIDPRFVAALCPRS